MGSLLEFSKKNGLAGDKVAVADLGEGPGGVPLLIFYFFSTDLLGTPLENTT